MTFRRVPTQRQGGRSGWLCRFLRYLWECKQPPGAEPGSRSDPLCGQAARGARVRGEKPVPNSTTSALSRKGGEGGRAGGLEARAAWREKDLLVSRDFWGRVCKAGAHRISNGKRL